MIPARASMKRCDRRKTAPSASARVYMYIHIYMNIYICIIYIKTYIHFCMLNATRASFEETLWSKNSAVSMSAGIHVYTYICVHIYMYNIYKDWYTFMYVKWYLSELWRNVVIEEKQRRQHECGGDGGGDMPEGWRTVSVRTQC